MASEYTIETAPRDAGELARSGRFMIRQLAEKLGFFADEETKAKFMAGDNVAQAEACVMKLKQLDAGGGKNGSAAAPAAAAAPATTTKRTPVNGSKKGGAAATAAPAEAPANDAVQQLLGVIGELKDQVGALGEQVDGLSSQLDEAQTAVKGTNRLLVISMALNLMLAEQVLGGATRDAVVKAAMDDQDDILKLLQTHGLELAATDDEPSGE